jgi:hypothetical protein
MRSALLLWAAATTVTLADGGAGAAQPTSGLDIASWGTTVGAPNGDLLLSGTSHRGYYRAYHCARFADARAVIAAIPPPKQPRVTARAQTAAMRSALKRLRCMPASGTYQVTGLGPEVEINHGFEASENWTALEALATGGRTVGLVFDSSPYAISN